MFNSGQIESLKHSASPMVLRSLTSFTLMILFLSSPSLLAASNESEAAQPSTNNGVSTTNAQENSLAAEEILQQVKSSKNKVVQLVQDVMKELKDYDETLSDLRKTIRSDSEIIIRKFIEKTRGMNLEGLKSQWQLQSPHQKQVCNKFGNAVSSERKRLNELLFKLKTVSSKLEDYIFAANSQFQDFEDLLPSLPHGAHLLLSSSIGPLKSLIEKAEKDLREKLDEKVSAADDLHEQVETFTRTKWSLAYDTNKVMDRFFLANDPLGESVFMLKKQTHGIIKEIKRIKSETEKNKFQNIYFLKVNFLDLCSNAQNCHAEDLWVEYNPKINLQLNKSVFIYNDKGSALDVEKGDKIQVGQSIFINEDGVTAFMKDPSQDPQDEMDTESAALLNGAIKNDNDSNNNDNNIAKNNQVILNQRSLAEVEVPEVSKAGQLITAANGFAVSCQEYIQKNNQFGTIGKAILKNINLNTTPVLFDDDIGDLKSSPKKICPNYPDFSQAEKVDFMVYYGAAIGMAESTCNSNVKAKGPNGTLIGQWQMHLGKTHAYAGGVCGKINPSNGAQNTVCGLKMLNFYTGMAKNTNKELFYSRNYWETMHYPRPGAKKALALIHKFPGCFSR